MKLSEKLTVIQSSLKAPKNQTNTFGKYKYRSLEDICEAVKPLLKDNGLVLTITDSIESIGDFIFLKATAQITDGNEAISVSAYARHPVDKKGMDDSQITGATSSYARKYCLNGLFLIDDTKDADATQQPAPKSAKAHKEVSQLTEYYPTSDFNKNFPAWEKLISSGSHTAASIITKIEAKAPLSEHQKNRLKEIKVTEVMQ